MNNQLKKAGNLPYTFPQIGFFGWFIIFSVSTGILVIERFTPIEINNFYARLTLYIISASLLSFWVGWILFGFKAVAKRKAIFFTVLSVCLLKAYLTWSSDWKTQTILYTNTTNQLKTVEFQMRGDWFAFGYKKRVVERQKIFLFLDYVTDVDTTRLNPGIWKKSGKIVNQLGIQDFNDSPD